MIYYAVRPMGVGASSLTHHGIKGQKWGVRRYQNEDGTLTAAGQKRYGTQEKADYASLSRKQKKDVKNFEKAERNKAFKKASEEYGKANQYAEKHGLDVDDVVDKDERKAYEKASKKAGDWAKVGKHVIEYNKMLDAAEIKENEYYALAKQLVADYVKQTAASNRTSFVDPNPNLRKVPGRVMSDGASDYQPKRPKNVLY